ncbi:hypothetical protein ppKF707_5716 [Metapseudomonas furukawaii]|uniref:Uncharacterized protein n=1 Tax=Metapseudomonas furukawaii TaxID=1149133 RepID=A0AAD1FEC0_METFU|nr:hypothetical protein ppKF707_5716 [Pseudomonas furukawaii]BAU72779.1 hypothetical protein KF707C_10910 [Pseudomonas furukawaii]
MYGGQNYDHCFRTDWFDNQSIRRVRNVSHDGYVQFAL